jgi:hypothetical protein
MITGPPNPISRAKAAPGERSTTRVADGEIRPVIVTSISLPFATLVTLALEPIGILGWAALKPSVVISCVAIPRWVNGCLCAMQKPVVNNNPSIANITRLILNPLSLPEQIPGAKQALPLIIIHIKKNTRFFRILPKKKARRLPTLRRSGSVEKRCN